MKIRDPKIRQVLESHDFGEPRGLNDYIELFGFPLADALKKLRPMDHWLDAGSGEGRAIQEYRLASSKQDVFTTAVTLKSMTALAAPTHKTIVNYLEEIPQDQIRSCDIITDVSGGLQFTEQPDLLLRRYLMWLKPSGVLFIHLDPGTSFVDRSGQRLPLLDWIREIPGLKAEEGKDAGSVALRKDQTPHPIPRLKLVEAKLGSHLVRVFRES